MYHDFSLLKRQCRPVGPSRLGRVLLGRHLGAAAKLLTNVPAGNDDAAEAIGADAMGILEGPREAVHKADVPAWVPSRPSHREQ